MFDRLFTLPAARARHRDGPLAEERGRFLAHLDDLGVARRTLREHADRLLVIADALGLAGRPDGAVISRDEIRRGAVGDRDNFSRLAVRWLRFLGRLERRPVPTGAWADRIEAFARHMRDERRLSPVTVVDRCDALRRFFERLGAFGPAPDDLTPARIDGALLGMVSGGGYASRTVRDRASHLRVFLRYAEARGWCRPGLAASVFSPRVYTHASLPQGPTWDQVRQLLATTEGDRPADVRDRAILMLLAVYGLRAGEVRRLRLDDVDWDRELLRVASPKTGRTRTVPLARPAGDAVLRYLREVRPRRSPHREVFLTLVAPVRPLRQLWNPVGRRLRALGVATPHVGPHALRHACATHLLADGFTLKEIGDHLGHRQPNTTRIYAKVDLAGLRRVGDFPLEVLS
jgi:site-specific recombinase XerD